MGSHKESIRTNALSPGPQLSLLGPTSYSAVFSEDRTINGDNSPFREEWIENETTDYPSFREGRVEEGAKMLASLKDFPLFESMIQKWQDDVHGATMFCPWIMTCVASVRAEIYEQLMQQPKEQQEPVLIRLSNKLFYNSLTPLKVDGTWTVDDYAMSFNGLKIRWETVGMFFTAVGLAAMKRAPQRVEQIFARAGNMVPEALARRMIDLAQSCLTFCEEAGHLNDAEIWIRYELTLLTSVIEGDASM
jgi:chromatin structure-remodeling complex subunit RSC3/30